MQACSNRMQPSTTFWTTLDLPWFTARGSASSALQAKASISGLQQLLQLPELYQLWQCCTSCCPNHSSAWNSTKSNGYFLAKPSVIRESSHIEWISSEGIIKWTTRPRQDSLFEYQGTRFAQACYQAHQAPLLHVPCLHSKARAHNAFFWLPWRCCLHQVPTICAGLLRAFQCKSCKRVSIFYLRYFHAKIHIISTIFGAIVSSAPIWAPSNHYTHLWLAHS